MKHIHNPFRPRFFLEITAVLTAFALIVSLCPVLATQTFALDDSVEEDTLQTTQPEASQSPSVEYIVPEGATLEAIANYYRVSAEDILTFNGIDALTPGQTIRIPNPATRLPYEPPQEYVVVRGDTLTEIANAYDVPLMDLCSRNNLSVSSIIYPGMTLIIPVIHETEITEPEETKPVTAEPETQAPETEKSESTDIEAAVAEKIPDDTVYVCGVPLYFQDDYPDTLYGDGTVKTSGCSVTSLTMVANSVTGYDYEVDELAEYFGGRALNHIERLEKGSKTLGLSFHKTENWYETWEALKDGKIAIALMDGIGRDCLFTDSQHFIVLAGLNEQGKIMVNDSNKGNYDKWNLKNGFETGFDPDDILCGYSGAWVYDRHMEELPERYREERLIKTEENKNYPGITLTAAERELLARVIWVEARGECDEGQQAIAEVVFNRLTSDQFSNSMDGVIYGAGQFRSVPYLEDAEPGQAQYQAIDRAMYGNLVLEKSVFYFATTPTNENVYKQIGNHIFCY